MKTATASTDQKWLKVLNKGLITLPKSWRKKLKLEEGNIVNAKQIGDTIVIEAIKPSERLPAQVPYRLYSQEEIDQFIRDDELSEQERQQLGIK